MLSILVFIKNPILHRADGGGEIALSSRRLVDSGESEDDEGTARVSTRGVVDDGDGGGDFDGGGFD